MLVPINDKIDFDKPNPMEGQQSEESRSAIYTATFCGGFTAGLAGELTSQILDGKFEENLVKSETLDMCIITGVQKVAKDFSEDLIRKSQIYNKMTPFMYGAATGLPMWAITKSVSVPINNLRKVNKDRESRKEFIFKDYFKELTDDLMYQSVSNGISQHFASVVFPNFSFPSIFAKKMTEAITAGCISASCFLLRWPTKTVLTGQSLMASSNIGSSKLVPKVTLKKLIYSYAKPQFVKMIV